MKLKTLIKNIPFKAIKGSKEIEITGICSNSKLVAPGNLFIARRGRAEDGMTYVPEAIAGGAVAVFTDILDPLLDKSVTQIIHPDVASIEGLIAANYYQFASQQMFMVGITGTNGKTTTSFLIKHLLDHFAGPAGLIGTIKYIIGDHQYDAVRTTPDAVSNQKMLREMVLHGCRSCVMEVTSHALDQGRVDCIDFDTAIFTNLTLDHLDYHKTMEEYGKAKSKLFRSLNPQNKKSVHPFPKTAIVNVDTPWHKTMVEGCRGRVITYGIDQAADLRAEDVVLDPEGTSLVICWKGQRIPFKWPLCGRFNVYNLLAAIGVGLSRSLTLEQILTVLSTAPGVPGRLQQVTNPLGLKIYVDFAHSDDALENVLRCLVEFKRGKIITVFGCGGNRDTLKRPKMARVAEQYSDIAVVTSDNPRNENPSDIVKQIVTGFSNKDSYIVEVDRRKAIEKAVDLATQDDIILIAGKGHEPYQIFAHQTIAFDDRVVALQACEAKALCTTNSIQSG